MHVDLKLSDTSVAFEGNSLFFKIMTAILDLYKTNIREIQSYDTKVLHYV